MQVAPNDKRHSLNSWTELLDPVAIFWGAFWALFFHAVPKVPRVVMGQWRSITSTRQFMLMSGLFTSAITVGMSLLSLVLSSYLDFVMASMLVSFPFFSLFLLKDEEGMTLWTKITHKLLVVPFLWRDYVTRTCKKCGYYDSSTRDLKITSGWQSAYEPCECCGSVDFEFNKLE